MLTFRGWLQLQTDREDPVGELARAVAGELCAGSCPFTDFPGFARHVTLEHDVAGPALAAVRVAGKQYRGYTRVRRLPSGRGP